MMPHVVLLACYFLGADFWIIFFLQLMVVMASCYGERD